MVGKCIFNFKLSQPIQILIGGGFLSAFIGVLFKSLFLKWLGVFCIIIGVIFLIPYVIKKIK